jgi:hypothetical protein
MNSFFNYPDCLLQDICSQWLRLADLQNLDTALCNHQLRNQYLFLLEGNKLSIEHDVIVVQRVEMCQALENGIDSEEEIDPEVRLLPLSRRDCPGAWYRPRLRYEFRRTVALLQSLFQKHFLIRSIMLSDYPSAIRELPSSALLHSSVRELRLVMGSDGGHMEIENYLAQFGVFSNVTSLAMKCKQSPVSGADVLIHSLNIFPRLTKLRLHTHGNFLRRDWGALCGPQTLSGIEGCRLCELELSKFVRLSIDGYLSLFMDPFFHFPKLQSLLLYAETQTMLETRSDLSILQVCRQFQSIQSSHAMIQLKRLEGNFLWLFPLMTSLASNVEKLVLVFNAKDSMLRRHGSFPQLNFSTTQLLSTLALCYQASHSGAVSPDALCVEPLKRLIDLEMVVILHSKQNQIMPRIELAAFLKYHVSNFCSFQFHTPKSRYAEFNHTSDLTSWFLPNSSENFQHLERLMLSHQVLTGGGISNSASCHEFWGNVLREWCPNLRHLQYQSHPDESYFYPAFASAISGLSNLRIETLTLTNLPVHLFNVETIPEGSNSKRKERNYFSAFLMSLQYLGSGLRGLSLQWPEMMNLSESISVDWGVLFNSWPMLQSFSLIDLYSRKFKSSINCYNSNVMRGRRTDEIRPSLSFPFDSSTTAIIANNLSSLEDEPIWRYSSAASSQLPPGRERKCMSAATADLLSRNRICLSKNNFLFHISFRQKRSLRHLHLELCSYALMEKQNSILADSCYPLTILFSPQDVLERVVYSFDRLSTCSVGVFELKQYELDAQVREALNWRGAKRSCKIDLVGV